MKIIFKFILNSTKNNKFRTFLIIFSIVLSTALFFASSSMSRTITKMYLSRIKQYYGSSDIIIHSGENSPSNFLSMNNAKKLSNKFVYIIGSIESNAYYKPAIDETNSVYLRGYNLDELQTINPIDITSSRDILPFSGKKIIINNIAAEKFNFKPGDVINLEINNSRQKFKIVGITNPSGPLQNEEKNIAGIVPLETMRLINNARGKVNVIYLKLKNLKEKKNVMAELSGLYSRYVVREPFSTIELKQYTDQIATPFMMMTTLILFMSVFIIYSSFKVITMERLPVIGTFRSIGAPRRTTDFVLIIESISYGLVGGIIGCILGIGVLYIMGRILSDNPWESVKTSVQIDFTAMHLIISFMLAVMLSFLSSIIPIVKISKIPVKDIVLNRIEQNINTKSWKSHLGLILITIAVIVPFITPRSLAIFIDVSCMLLTSFSVILLIPVITNFFVRFFQRIYTWIFGNEGVLASKNLNENKNILNNISLIAIGISSLLMINTVSYSVIEDTLNFYKGAKFNIWMWYYMADKSLISRINTTDGVEDSYGLYAAYNTEIILPVTDINKSGFLQQKGKNKIELIQGINKEKFLEYWKLDIDRDKLEKLDNSRNIMCSYFLKDKFALSEGEIINLRFNKSNRPYRIIGFFGSSRDNGDYALISERYFKLDTLYNFFNEIYIKTYKNPEEVEKTIKDKFGKNRPWINTITQMQKNELKSNAQMFTVLKGFSILSLIIGIFGVLNNFIISFIQRKRYLAIYRSVGMSKRQIIKMVFIEAFTGGLIGGIIGVATGVILIIIVSFAIKGLNLYLSMQYSPLLFVYSLATGIVISLIASISPAIKSSKLNIIEAIKYE